MSGGSLSTHLVSHRRKDASTAYCASACQQKWHGDVTAIVAHARHDAKRPGLIGFDRSGPVQGFLMWQCELAANRIPVRRMAL
jgi:hypothetical protein